jgi:hypothetical protein
VDHIAFARSYDADRVSLPSSSLESWHDQINSRARESSRFEYFSLATSAVRIGDRNVEVRRMAHYFPEIRVLDVMIEIRGTGLLASSWLDSEIHPGELKIDKGSITLSVAELMNQVYEDATGRSVEEGPLYPKRTIYGSIAFHPTRGKEAADVAGNEEGVGSGEFLSAAPNRMDAYAVEWCEEHRMSYVLLAALCARSRHLAWRVIDAARNLAANSDRDPHGVVTLGEALKVRRDAVLASIEMTGFGYLGTGGLVRVYDRIYHGAAVGPGVERAFAVSAEGLHQISDGLFTLTAERTGRLLSYIALVFTFASIFLGAIAAGEFFRLPYGTRWWVVGLWTAWIFSLTAVSVLLWRSRRVSRRANSLPSVGRLDSR